MSRKRRGGGGGGGGRPGGGGGGGGGGGSAPSGAERIFADVSYREARTIQAAVVLDVFTQLADGPSTAEDVAVRIATDKRATELLLNALCEIGYLAKRGDRFSNAPHAQAHLVRGQKGYIGWSIISDAMAWATWGKLEDSIRSGKRPEGPRTFFEDADRTKAVLKALHTRAEALFTRHVTERVRLDEATTLVDVGGGAGSYTIAFCRRWPKLSATVFDLPIAIEMAKETVGKTDVHKRVSFVEGDWRKDALGGPYDIAFLSNVIHGESLEGGKALVKRAFDALVPGGRIIIRDMIMVPERTGPEGAAFSLYMLLNTDEGRCYSAPEIEGMLKEAGFGEVKMIDAFQIIEGRKPGGAPRKAEAPVQEKRPPRPEKKPEEKKPEGKPEEKKPEGKAEETKPEPPPEPAAEAKPAAAPDKSPDKTTEDKPESD